MDTLHQAIDNQVCVREQANKHFPQSTSLEHKKGQTNQGKKNKPSGIQKRQQSKEE